MKQLLLKTSQKLFLSVIGLCIVSSSDAQTNLSISRIGLDSVDSWFFDTTLNNYTITDYYEKFHYDSLGRFNSSYTFSRDTNIIISSKKLGYQNSKVNNHEYFNEHYGYGTPETQSASFSYDNFGNIISLEVSSTDYIDPLNRFPYKVDFNYLNTKISSKLKSVFDSTTMQWNQVRKYEYYYTNNRLTSVEWFEKESPSNPWIKTEEYEIEYDINGLLSHISKSYIDSVDTFTRKDEYKYNSNNLVTRIFRYTKDSSGWEPLGTDSFAYDSFNNLVLEIGGYWEKDSNKYYYYHKDSFTYDYLNYVSSISHPINVDIENEYDWYTYHRNQINYPTNFKSTHAISKHYWAKSMDLKKGGYYSYHYSDIASSILDNQNLLRFNIYPNPSSGAINIKVEEPITHSILKIYNELGLLIYTQKNANSNSIEVKNLSKGLYIVTLETDNGFSTRKVVIQ